jgi:hypothetical protein
MARAGITSALSLTEHFGSTDKAMTQAARGLSELGADLARRRAPRDGSG